jgi:hypothetical protein
MRSRAAISFALLILLILAPVGTGIAVATIDSPGGGVESVDSADVRPATHEPDPGQVIRINITADGDARWTIEFREHLHDENETEAFRETIDAIVSGDERPPIGEDDMQRFVNESENATGREMAIQDTEYTGRIDNDTGVIAFHFTWTNFTEIENDGERLIVGDAFNGTSGRWLPSLSAGQRLIIDAPDGYYASTAPRAHESGTFEWNGPYEFTENDRPIVYSAQNNPGTSTLFDETDDPLPMALIGAGVFTLVIAVGTGGYLLARRQTSDGGGTIAGTLADGVESKSDDSGQSDGTPAPPGSPATGDEAAERDIAEGDEIDETLLSDEERVLRMLQSNGGRMKQANIVKETGWSNAKVSQLLSSMADNDQVDKLRIGRENLITLPDEDVGDLN